MTSQPPTEALAKLKDASYGLPGESANARKILHAIEGMAASWHKINDQPRMYSSESARDVAVGRGLMAVQGIALLLGTTQPKVREALENKWI